jgi:hypothetical protein
MSFVIDQKIDSYRARADLEQRIAWLESVQLAEQAEAEAALQNQYEIVKRSSHEEMARAGTLLFTRNQRVFEHLKTEEISEDFYAAISALMMAAETARRLLEKEVQI